MSNLYIQGGTRLQHVVYFVLGFAWNARTAAGGGELWPRASD